MKLSKLRKKKISRYAILLFFGLSLSSWAVSSPMGSSPDDDFHLTSIWCATVIGDTPCQLNDDGALVPYKLLSSLCYAAKPSIDGNCTKDTLYAGQEYRLKHVNEISGLYPPLFYKFFSLFKVSNLEYFSIIIRVINVVILLLVLWYIRIISTSVREWNSYLLGFTASIIPLGLFIIPSTNPSSWALIFLSAYWFSIYQFTSQPHKPEFRHQMLLLIVIFWCMVNFARSDGPALSLIATLSILILRIKSYSWRDSKFIILTLFSFSSAILFLIQRTGPSVLNGEMNVGIQRERVYEWSEILTANLKLIYWYFIGGNGLTGLGWLDTSVPGWVWKQISAVWIVIFMLATRLLIVQKRWSSLVAIIFLVVSYLFLPVTILQLNKAFVGELVQPRYVLPLVPLILIFAIVESGMRIKSTSVFLWFASGIWIFSFIKSLEANLLRYVNPLNLNQKGLSEPQWEPFGISPQLIFIFGAGCFIVYILLLILSQEKITPLVMRSKKR